jgi:hypothetical protein
MKDLKDFTFWLQSLSVARRREVKKLYGELRRTLPIEAAVRQVLVTSGIFDPISVSKP